MSGIRLLKMGRKNNGSILITVVLTVALVTALIVMALTSGMIGQSVSIQHVRERRLAQCSQSALMVAYDVLAKVSDEGASQIALINSKTEDTAGTKGTGISVSTNLARGDDTLNDFFEELSPNDTLVLDDILAVGGAAAANITIKAGTFAPECGASSVDVDYLFYNSLQGFARTTSGHPRKAGGAGCGKGDYYSIIAMTVPTGGAVPPIGNQTAMSIARSAFFKCL
ncbi:MAG: hypothetical protein AAB300_00185 [Nitrospirota bacterium]